MGIYSYESFATETTESTELLLVENQRISVLSVNSVVN